MPKNDPIGKRFKENYEGRNRTYLLRRTPVIIRLDGKAFHTFTRGCEKPFDMYLSKTMEGTALKLCNEIQGAKCAFVQSDEISLLLIDYDKLTTDAWFNYIVEKMTSISSAIASVEFTINYALFRDVQDFPIVFHNAYFDSRAFNVPREEVTNYFVWRQKDWLRNSIAMLAQSVFSHNELHKKSSGDMNEMCLAKGVEWGKLDNRWKNGVFIEKENNEWVAKTDAIFTQDRNIIEKFLYVDEIEE